RGRACSKARNRSRNRDNGAHLIREAARGGGVVCLHCEEVARSIRETGDGGACIVLSIDARRIIAAVRAVVQPVAGSVRYRVPSDLQLPRERISASSNQKKEQGQGVNEVVSPQHKQAQQIYRRHFSPTR